MATYTIADLKPTPPPHVNLWSVKLYDQNELEIALQGNFDSKQKRARGSSPVHHHYHDELVYLLDGDYGHHNRAKVEQLAWNFLRIRAGVEHGGDANGLWISAKPKDFRFFALDTSIRSIAYEGHPSDLGIKYYPMFEGLSNGGLSRLEIVVEEEEKPKILRVAAVNAKSRLRVELMSFEFLR
ncbi:hypothetical protein HYX06_05890 [Candidatus Woesearchaeota archaeon]|nr:hypothetical protein [Candidatus Woesearchaeota archaeon]